MVEIPLSYQVWSLEFKNLRTYLPYWAWFWIISPSNRKWTYSPRMPLNDDAILFLISSLFCTQICQIFLKTFKFQLKSHFTSFSSLILIFLKGFVILGSQFIYAQPYSARNVKLASWKKKMQWCPFCTKPTIFNLKLCIFNLISYD